MTQLQHLLTTRKLDPITLYLGIEADKLGSSLYGIAVCMMWLRTLNFMLMEKHLGQVQAVLIKYLSFQQFAPPELICLLMQFVRVMLNMAKDLGFFSVVWVVLTLAFGAAMHGALHGEDYWGDNSLPGGGANRPVENGESSLPMQRWSTWWLIRTYLQSLGEVALHLQRH
jgi:hypothetical protein